MSNFELIHGDCLEEMERLGVLGTKVDLVLTDPPYGTTACKWDSVIPFNRMWAALLPLVKPNAAICLFGSEPFSSTLRLSAVKYFRYDWYWNKKRAANFLFMNKQPGKIVELCSVFYAKQPTYIPQKRDNPTGMSTKHLYANHRKITANVRELMKTKQDMVGRKNFSGKNYEPGKLLPNTILEFVKDTKRFHPTQKPVALLEYLIKTYTLEGEIVLDFTMGSGSTGVACKNLGRKFIGIEKDEKFFDVAKQRILASHKKH